MGFCISMICLLKTDP